jgi:Zn ribbon nucleic-acid-binding protein
VNAALEFRVLAELARGRHVADAICPVCSHQRQRRNQHKRVMRLWAEPDFITFHCAHCGASGYARSSSTVNAGEVERWRRHAQKRQRDDQQYRLVLARATWDRGTDPRGTVAENYLRSRCLTIPDDIAGSQLRYLADCPWRRDDDHPDYPAGPKPTLLAAFRSIPTDELAAVHRIRLDVPQRWPKTLRKMLGPVAGAAVKLLAEVGDTLAIAEGVETAMAANAMGYGPAWALGSALAVANFPVLVGVRRLILLVENNETSRGACERCGERWRQAGRRVTRVVPDHGDDLNDELMLKGQNNNGANI